MRTPAIKSTGVLSDKIAKLLITNYSKLQYEIF